MTPYHDWISERIDLLSTRAPDPEAFHAERDMLYRLVLHHIVAGCHKPEEIASVVLKAEAIPVRWEACA